MSKKSVFSWQIIEFLNDLLEFFFGLSFFGLEFFFEMSKKSLKLPLLGRRNKKTPTKLDVNIPDLANQSLWCGVGVV